MVFDSKFVRCWLLGIALAMPVHCLHAENRLVLLNWDDYLDQGLVQQFEEQHDAEIVETPFSSEEDRTSRLATGNGRGYDLILTSGVDLGLYVRRGWIAPIDESKLPVLADIDPVLRDAYPHANQYAVPYGWGTLGVLYRNDLVPAPITSWMQLYRPAPELRGKISLLEDGRELIGMGLKALGYSANSYEVGQLDEVEQLLLEQKPFVKSYIYLSLDFDTEILNGEIVASMAYSPDALMIMETSSQLSYVVPEEGSNIWIDYLAVATHSQNPELAYKFLNFINKPENAAAQARTLKLGSANLAAKKLLPAEHLENLLLYPGEAQLEKLEYYTLLPAKAQRERNRITTRVMR